ncbi:hypothetical protein HMPREF9151_01233 [Hoylesella saccharolytica F0055]|uniref:Uncharacterized protein n=1 Tax=Hoylesella saccharolytica F0055 TaxID=1127699 RepID=L1NBG6_9BACT|nr:hypothetical protein HMPREF9151_01233 [Hoylesella saccharolytica F0055]
MLLLQAFDTTFHFFDTWKLVNFKKNVTMQENEKGAPKPDVRARLIIRFTSCLLISFHPFLL